MHRKDVPPEHRDRPSGNKGCRNGGTEAICWASNIMIVWLASLIKDVRTAMIATRLQRVRSSVPRLRMGKAYPESLTWRH